MLWEHAWKRSSNELSEVPCYDSIIGAGGKSALYKNEGLEKAESCTHAKGFALTGAPLFLHNDIQLAAANTLTKKGRELCLEKRL